jgi:hypothetical protein
MPRLLVVLVLFASVAVAGCLHRDPLSPFGVPEATPGLP